MTTSLDSDGSKKIPEPYSPSMSDTFPEPDLVVKKNYILLKKGSYPLSFSEMNTPKQLLWKIHHLTEKGWVDNEIIRKLIEVAVEKMGIRMYDPQG